MIKDLEKFCRNFIINTKTRKNSPKDIFKYMELNVKCCDDEIATFVLQGTELRFNIKIISF